MIFALLIVGGLIAAAAAAAANTPAPVAAKPPQAPALSGTPNRTDFYPTSKDVRAATDVSQGGPIVFNPIKATSGGGAPSTPASVPPGAPGGAPAGAGGGGTGATGGRGIPNVF